MKPTREEIIRLRLNKMAVWAKQRRAFLAEPPKEWKEDWYIRIGGNGFRAVSVSSERPQLGFNSSAKRKIGSVLNDFNEKYGDGPIRVTPEKQIQSLLIRYAINNKLDVHKLLCLDASVYSRLLFALDEVALGDKKHTPKQVCDILAVGVYEGTAYPVLIELKSSRDLSRLLTQLAGYEWEMKYFEAEFRPLLEECVGREVNLSKVARMIIWPSLETDTRDTIIRTCRERQVSLIEYNKKNLKFTPKLVCPPARRLLCGLL